MRSIPIYSRTGVVAYAIVDTDVFAQIGHMRWTISRSKNTSYAQRAWKFKGGGSGPMAMHRCVMGVTGRNRNTVVDHINHDGLDNRRANLRVVTPRQNARNKRSKCVLASAAVAFSALCDPTKRAWSTQ